MSETPWTPGPWRAGFAENCFAVPPEDEVELAILPHPNLDAVEIYGKRRDYNSQDEFDANARLISAAPEMAEALSTKPRISNLNAFMDSELANQVAAQFPEVAMFLGAYSMWCIQADEALSKARGQS